MVKKNISKAIFSLLLFLLVFNLFTESTYAKSGEFYKEYKDVIEKEIESKNQREFIEKYDYVTNEFDCGTFDIVCMYKGAQYTGIIGFIRQSYKGFGPAIVDPTEITGNATFKKYKNAFSTLSTTMLAIFLMWQMMKIVAQRFAEPEDGMLAINEKLLTIVGSGILLFLYDKFYIWLLDFQHMVISQIVKETFSTKELVLSVFLKGSLFGEFTAFIMMIAVSIFTIVFAYRFILFGFLYITGVLAIPTAVNDEYNYFSLWLRLIINNGVTLFLQVLAFSVGLNVLMNLEGAFGGFTSFTLSMGFFMLAVAVPSLLGQMGASSGTSRAIGTAVRYVARR